MASLSLVFDLLARDKASPAFRDVGTAADRAGKSAGNFGSSVGGAMKVAAGAIAAAGIGRAFAGFVTDAAESAKIGRLTAAVITSTGGAAKITADQVSALATSISNKTAVDDEAIQSASNLLLTFTKVRNETGKGNDIFNQATQAAIDMSTAMGTDANGAALQLGKALNDPVKGVTALAKAGVSFTQQQKDQIKAMVEAGDTLGAQKIILGEMQTQFGGAAAAAADPMARLRVIAGNLGETIGAALLPAIGSFSNYLSDKAIPTIGRLWGMLKDNLGPVFTEIAGGVRAFAAAWKYNDGEITSSGFPGLMERLGYVAHQTFDYIRESVIPTLADFGGWIKRNADIILPFVAALGAGYVVFQTITAVTKAWAAAQAILNAVMVANPIGLVIVAIAALVAGLVVAYQRSDTFREIVDKAFRAVAEAGRWMWETVLKPAFEALSAYVIFMWNNVIKPYFGFVMDFWTTVARAVMWAWENIIRPAWNALSAAVQFLWNNVLSPVFGFISSAWQTLGSGISTVYNNVIRPIWGFFTGAVEGLRNTFDTVVGAIGRAWDTLKSKLETPVRAVIGFVNDKVIGNLNKVTSVFGLTIPNIPGFAQGGYTGDGGKYEAAGVVHRGEYVFSKEQTAALGKDRLAALARGRRSETDEIGGPWDIAKAVGGKIADGAGNLVDAAGNVIGNVKDAVGSAVSWTGEKIGDLVAKGIGFALDKIIRPVGGWISDKIGNPFVRDFGKGVFNKTADAARRWGDDRDTAEVASGASGPIGSGVAGGSWQALWAKVQQAFPTARKTSDYRPGDPGFHGRGKALDVAGARPGDANAMMAINRWAASTMGSNLAELIYTPGINLYRGKPHTYGAATRADHYDHVHMATYDQGGILPPGFTMAYNGTGKNETIRTAGQEAALNGPVQVVLQLDRDAVTDLLEGRVVQTLGTRRAAQTMRTGIAVLEREQR